MLTIIILTSAAIYAYSAGTTQVYSYTRTSHRLNSTTVAVTHNPNSHPTPNNTTNYSYTIGTAANSITNIFSSGNNPGIATDTNNFSFDPTSGVRTEYTDTKGNKLAYVYNSNGIKSISQNQKTVIIYFHNHFDQVTQIKRSSGYSTFNHYGANGKLDEIIIGSSNSVSLAKEAWLYNYGAGGNLESVTIISNTKKSNGQINYQYNYNDHNQLTNIVVPAKAEIQSEELNPTDTFGNPIKSRIYTYSLNNNINTISTIYIAALGSAQLSLHYYYNRALGEPNQLRFVNTKLPIQNISNYKSFLAEVDAEHRLNNIAYQYNSYGAITTDPEGDTYQYNNLNQMIFRHTQTGSHQDYGYGTNGLMDYEQSYLSHLDPGLRRDDGASVYFFYAGVTQPQEQQQGNITNFYLPGLATFSDSSLRAKRGNLTKTYLYEVAQGNVALTSNNKDINNQYFYTPYGQQDNLYQQNIIKPQKSGHNSYAQLINQTLHPLDITKNSFGYTGQAKDQSTGLMTLGNFRNYAPMLGRFIQPDTYTSFMHIFNSYAYVRANPIVNNDTSGHIGGDDDDDGDGDSVEMAEELFAEAQWSRYLHVENDEKREYRVILSKMTIAASKLPPYNLETMRFTVSKTPPLGLMTTPESINAEAKLTLSFAKERSAEIDRLRVQWLQSISQQELVAFNNKLIRYHALSIHILTAKKTFDSDRALIIEHREAEEDLDQIDGASKVFFKEASKCLDEDQYLSNSLKGTGYENYDRYDLDETQAFHIAVRRSAAEWMVLHTLTSPEW